MTKRTPGKGRQSTLHDATPDLFEDLFEDPSDGSATAPHPALDDIDALVALLDRWVERGWLRALDRALAVFLHREVNDGPPLLLLAAALASHQLGRGHVCLDLAQTLAAPNLALSLPPEGDDLSDPPPLPSQVLEGLELERWRAALDHPPLVADGLDDHSGNTPLVKLESLGSVRLYLRRYWQYEQDIRQQINARLAASEAASDESATPLRQALDALFPGNGPTPGPDWQKIACALAARSRFAVITGGPGTGKTTTVVKLLALLQSQQLVHTERALRIRLAAPTGKAAARLNESIAGQVGGLTLDGVTDDPESLKRQIPTEVTTLHRLLGSRPDTRHFRHHASNPLALDVLVIDEASMVDIEMMAAVLGALPPRARLILLGDKDQLASVEAGAVLGDLCQRAEGGHYTPATCAWLERVCDAPVPDDYRDTHGQPLDQAIAMLRVSHRFDAASGIGQLAQAVNAPLIGDHQSRDKQHAIRDVFRAGYADIARLALADADDPAFERLVVDGNPAGFANRGVGRHGKTGELAPPTGYRHYLDVLHHQRPNQRALVEASVDRQRKLFDGWALAVLEAHNRFQLLCALRKGPWGVEGLNLRIGQALRRHGLLNASDAELERGWYLGRPVLVTRNDYGLGLMNGDIGITLAQPHPQDPSKRVLRVAFPTADADKPIKWVLPSRLQAVGTVFAMTVHKSQGSEFTHTALLLPDAPNPILTRELVYTGITRARHWLTLVETGRGMLDEAVSREVVRVSGLESLKSPSHNRLG
ncbi:exodeoxyribonuclease V subunit alpha [Halomonas sp. HP20-15]|uniref:exodeoxyribonuclease V subunit alpha n=1 Tax=Halomonas sp. HP20-15 TaxID=3085901 RepID=UPI002980D357|nr:exodeoxyribonuclease V subunit alpha [Halomonas sp. HP20-15]MDW5377756.1 exodeoxyribonuclease V subunit alpha [Halomonas sp. HP20-15]